MIDKGKATQESFEMIEKYCSIDSAEKAVASMSDQEMIQFLSSYYLSESLSYDEEINKKSEEALIILEKELEKGTKSPFSPALMESLINLCKLSIIDGIVEEVIKVNQQLHKALRPYDILDKNVPMIYQMSMAGIIQNYMQSLSNEIANECASRGIEPQSFMKESFPVISSDFSMIFEIDNFVGLKNYEKNKDIKVDLEKIIKFSKQTIEYTKMLLDQKIDPQMVTIFPSLVSHYLVLKTGIDSYQALATIIATLKSDEKMNHLPFFRQILEEIWYTENGRAIIFAIFQQQMELLEQMTKNGYNPAMMQGMDPAMMQGMDPAMMQGMDPNMMGNLDPFAMGGFDPAMMQGMDPGMMQHMMEGINPDMIKEMSKNISPQMVESMMKNMTPEMLTQMSKEFNPELAQKIVQGMDPALIQQFKQNLDPSLMQHMMTGMTQNSTIVNQTFDPVALNGMMEGLKLGSELGNQNIDQTEQIQKMTEALQKEDFDALEASIPAHVREALEKLKKQQNDKNN